MKYLTVIVTLLLIGCATQPIDMHSAATSELLERRAEINRKLGEDDFGVDWGVTRWISHAAEKNSVLKEKAVIDAELARRHVTRDYPIATPTGQPGMVRSPYTGRLYDVRAVPHGALVHDVDANKLFRRP
jgi:hypothetical protein